MGPLHSDGCCIHVRGLKVDRKYRSITLVRDPRRQTWSVKTNRENDGALTLCPAGGTSALGNVTWLGNPFDENALDYVLDQCGPVTPPGTSLGTKRAFPVQNAL